MGKKRVWGNTIVKNEGRYIFFSLMSVIDFLDRILVWDTGSSDDTIKIIKHIQKKYPKKLIFYLGNGKNLKQALEKLLLPPTTYHLPAVLVMMGAGDIVNYTDSLIRN